MHDADVFDHQIIDFPFFVDAMESVVDSERLLFIADDPSVQPAQSFHRRFRVCRGHSDFFRQSSETILRLAAQVQLDLLSLQPFFFIGVHDV